MPDDPVTDDPVTDDPVTDDAERDDAELLRAHADGDTEAFAMLFTRHRDRLWAVALRTMGNPEDAADGLQDGLIAAYRRAGSFRGEAQVTTWLHRVVVNACLDRLRAAKVRRADPLPDDVEERAGRGSSYTSTGRVEDPAEVALAGERRDRVLAVLATLPAEQRAALVLVDMEGYPVAEVALMLDCAEGTVKSRCSRGRSRLALLLADQLPSDAAAGDRHHGVVREPGLPRGRPTRDVPEERADPTEDPRGGVTR